jgi:hypothetical protein
MKKRNMFSLVALIFSLALPILMAGFSKPALAADDEPTIAKDSVRLKVKTSRCAFGEQGCDKNTNFLDPSFEFDVNGPIAGGSQLSVEITVPGKPPRKWNCDTREIKKGRVLSTSCGSNGTEGDRGVAFQGVVYTGPVSFSINMSNELLQTNATLFAGKAKVGKFKPSPTAETQYYVDEDWRIPIGYIFFDNNSPSSFHSVIWFHGNPGAVKAYLFFQGKQVAREQNGGSGDDVWNPAKYEWWRIDSHFDDVLAEDPSALWGPNHPPVHLLSKTPGEYEIKVISGGHLARSMKFTVAADGTFDNGIAAANKLGSNRAIVPVQVIGEQGPWDKTAWKTGAFYGNPLTGFTPAQ